MPASGPHVGGVLLSRRPGTRFSYNRELPITAEPTAWDSGSVITENLPSLLSRGPGTRFSYDRELPITAEPRAWDSGSVMTENLPSLLSRRPGTRFSYDREPPLSLLNFFPLSPWKK